MVPRCTRRELLCRASAGLVVGAGVSLGSGRAGAQGQSAFEELKRQAWQKVIDGNNAPNGGEQRRIFRQARDLFLRADAAGRLGEDELAQVSALSRNFLWEPDLGERYARRSFGEHPNSVWAALECARAMYGAGHFAESRRLLRELVALPADSQGKWAKEIAEAAYRLATKTWEFAFDIKRAYLQRDYARKRLQTVGYHEFYCLHDTAYQRIAVAVDGAARHDETVDAGGNRLLRMWPDGDKEIHLKLTIEMQPWRFDILRIGQGAYELPEAVRPYLGRTVLCDPTTDKAQAVARKCKAQTRGETVRNVLMWMAEYFLNAGPGPATDRFEEHFGAGRYTGKPGVEWTTDGLLDYPVGHCWENSRLTACLLRACGIAARQRLVLLVAREGSDASGWFAGWHLIAEYYEPKHGWIPLETAREVTPGMVLDAMIPMMGEVPDTTTERETAEPWPLVSVDKAWRVMWCGNVGMTDANIAHVQRKLVRCALDAPYPWPARP